MSDAPHNPDLTRHENGSATFSKERLNVAVEAALQMVRLGPLIDHAAKHANDDDMDFQGYLNVRYLCQRLVALAECQVEALTDVIVPTQEISERVFLGVDSDYE